jgi:hypothetical protein
VVQFTAAVATADPLLVTIALPNDHAAVANSATATADVIDITTVLPNPVMVPFAVTPRADPLTITTSLPTDNVITHLPTTCVADPLLVTSLLRLPNAIGAAVTPLADPILVTVDIPTASVAAGTPVAAEAGTLDVTLTLNAEVTGAFLLVTCDPIIVPVSLQGETSSLFRATADPIDVTTSVADMGWVRHNWVAWPTLDVTVSLPDPIVRHRWRAILVEPLQVRVYMRQPIAVQPPLFTWPLAPRNTYAGRFMIHPQGADEYQDDYDYVTGLGFDVVETRPRAGQTELLVSCDRSVITNMLRQSDNHVRRLETPYVLWPMDEGEELSPAQISKGAQSRSKIH